MADALHSSLQCSRILHEKIVSFQHHIRHMPAFPIPIRVYRDLSAHLPIAQNTLYRIYSMTKPITAVVALRLWEKGAFRLDGSVEERMPAFHNLKIKGSLPDGTTACAPSPSPLRVMDLLTMTAGFDYNTESPNLSALYKKTALRHTIRDVAETLARQPLSFPPGERWEYGLSFDVLAAFLEAVSGVPFGTLLREMVFEPLSMSSAAYEHEEADNPLLCHAYRMDRMGRYVRGPGLSNMLRSPLFEGGGTGLVMTVEDYAKFACMLTGYGIGVNSTRMLQKGTVEMMSQNHLHGRQLDDFFLFPYGPSWIRIWFRRSYAG